MFLRLLLGLFAMSAVYASDYVFFSPETISSHLSGYNDVEKAAIEKDLSVVRSVCLSHTSPTSIKTPLYIATAGGPGARKSTILERFLHHHPELKNSVYLDPNTRGLRFMVHTYYDQSLNFYIIGESKNYENVIKTAYEKWQGASNYIALTLLEEALQERRDIIFGTTSTGSHIGPFFSELKKAGYRIELLLCSCFDDLREESVEYRNKEIRFYQSSPEEAVSKGKLFSERMPQYFQYADKLYFYWSDELFQPEHLAAVLDGKDFVITDLDAYVKFVGKYELDRKMHHAEGIELPSFKELIISRTGKNE